MVFRMKSHMVIEKALKRVVSMTVLLVNVPSWPISLAIT